MRSKVMLMLACVLTFAVAGLASAKVVLPEFQTKQQLAQRRANAEKAAAQDVAVKAAGQPVFFTGKPYDAASGNYVFKYRNYNPGLARWTSADPSGFPDGANNQVYVNNHILCFLDTDGLKIINNSDYTVYYKEEDTSATHAVAPHTTYDGLQDGLTSNLHHDQVYKTCDNIDATVNLDGTITWSGGSLLEQALQVASGGWKDKSWVDKHLDWLPLYNCAE